MTKPTDNHSADPAIPEETPKGPEPVIPGQMSLDLLDGGTLTASTLEWSALEHTIGWDPETKTIDTAALEKAKDSSRKLAKQLLDTVSAGPPSDIHAWLMSVKESPTMPLATYWYQDANTDFFMGDYTDALLMVYPDLDLKAIAGPLTQKINDWKAASRFHGEELTPPDVISDLTLADLLSRWTPDGTKQSVADTILEEIAAETGGQLPTITLTRTKGQYFPVDILNQTFWKLEQDELGKRLFVPTTNKGGQVIFSATLTKDHLAEVGAKINKSLTPYGERLYYACDALLESGNMEASASAIYHQMGGTADVPSGGDKAKVLAEMKNQRYIDLTIENKEKETDPSSRYPEFDYNGALLPNEYIRERSVINGGVVEGYIHFLRPELPLTEFSKGRKQGTTYPPKVFRTPNSLTDSNIAMENYLLDRIAAAQSGSLSCDILWSAIYEAAGVDGKTRAAKARCKGRAEAALKYWMGLPDSKKGTPGCKIIEGYDYFDKGYDPKRKINHTESGITIIPLGKQTKQTKGGKGKEALEDSKDKDTKTE